MKRIPSLAWEIVIHSNVNIDRADHFMETFIPPGKEKWSFLQIIHTQSKIFDILEPTEWHVELSCDWINWNPKDLAFYLIQKISEKLIKQWKLVFHGGTIFHPEKWYWIMIIWNSWSGKTSSIINMILNFWYNYWSNTKTVLGQGWWISRFEWWPNMISLRNNSFEFFPSESRIKLKQNAEYENADWTYVRLKEKLLTKHNPINHIVDVKISTTDSHEIIDDHTQKMIILLANLDHHQSSVMMDPEFVYYPKYLSENWPQVTNSLNLLLEHVKVHQIQWSMKFITDQLKTLNYV